MNANNRTVIFMLWLIFSGQQDKGSFWQWFAYGVMVILVLLDVIEATLHVLIKRQEKILESLKEKL